MDTLIGRVSSIKWRNERTGETRGSMTPEVPGPKKVSSRFIGHFLIPPAKGEILKLTGNWGRDERGEETFRVVSIERRLPESQEGQVTWLRQRVKGMRVDDAKALIEHFGSIRGLAAACQNDPDVLTRLLPRSPKLRARLRMFPWDRDEYDPELSQHFAAAGVRADQVQRLIQHFGAGTLKVIVQTRPYDLCDAKRIGFTTADKIAFHFARLHGQRFDHLNPERLVRGVVDLLGKERQQGNVCVPEKFLIARAFAKLRAPNEDPLPRGRATETALKDAISQALRRHLILREFDMLYTLGLHRAEKEVAIRIAKLRHAATAPSKSEERKILRILDEDPKGSKLNDQQRAAVVSAITRPVTIIRGGPGTGKTLTQSCVVLVLKKLGYTFRLLAPTGKAAKRASEVAGEEASTIHRACGLDQDDDVHDRRYGRPLRPGEMFREDFILADEGAMIDLTVFYELIRRIAPGRTRLVIFGDEAQLPPVGEGQPFRDMIDSGVVHSCHLTQIYRAAGDSAIVDGAYAIKEGRVPTAPADSYEVRILDPETARAFPADASPEERAEAEAGVMHRWLTYVVRHYREELGLDPLKDIQIYSPQNKGPAGVIRLNEILRDLLNPLSEGTRVERCIKISGGFPLGIGDKVMQIHNCYRMRFISSAPADATAVYEERLKAREKATRKRKKSKKKMQAPPTAGDVVPVFNGQVGYVTRIDDRMKEIEVKFDDLPYAILYKNSKEWANLAPAYAMSIHRSQGSETPCAVICMHSNSTVNRPLLYTGWTRAKKHVVVIATAATLERAVTNLRGVTRFTGLAPRCQEYDRNPAVPV